jgi:hypothetical protein
LKNEKGKRGVMIDPSPLLHPKSLGAPLEREVIVVRIDKSYLKLYSFLLGFVLLLVIIGVLWGLDPVPASNVSSAPQSGL